MTGFCMGGRIAWMMAAVNPIFKATVPFYGGNIMGIWGAGTQTPYDAAANINCPMLFHFGSIDANPSLDDRDKFDAELTRLGKHHEFLHLRGRRPRFHGLHQLPNATTKQASEAAWA